MPTEDQSTRSWTVRPGRWDLVLSADERGQQTIHVLGRGDHATVVIDALVASFLADVHVRFVHVVPSVSASDEVAEAELCRNPPSGLVVVNGIGFVGGANRRELAYQQLRASQIEISTVRHPSAVVASNARLEPGAQVMAIASLGPYATIEANALLNTGAIAEHHTTIGAHAHVGPGAVLCGRVTIGAGAFVGAGATIVPGVSVGERAVVGAGSTVLSDVPEGLCVVGSPARPIG